MSYSKLLYPLDEGEMEGVRVEVEVRGDARDIKQLARLTRTLCLRSIPSLAVQLHPVGWLNEIIGAVDQI